MLVWAAAGSAPGRLVGTFVIAPLVTATTVKLLFSCLWMSFGLLTITKNSEFCSLTTNPKIDPRQAMIMGLCVGIPGGIVTSLIGVGVEMMLYTTLVLVFRCDLKVAVPTAVSTMAVASVLATALHLYIGDISMEVFHNWLAAGPIVVFGASARFTSSRCYVSCSLSGRSIRSSPAVPSGASSPSR
jgi:uncharacterized membrane protein YfcA